LILLVLLRENQNRCMVRLHIWNSNATYFTTISLFF
jgi:hypothetical protein